MRYIIIATTVLFCLIGQFGQAQIRVMGGVVIGDITQTHLLVQKDSTRLVGRCLGISADSVTFEHRAQTRKFAANAVAYLRIVNSTDEVIAYAQTSDFIYMGKTQRDFAFHGKFVKMQGELLTLEDRDKQQIVYMLEEIKSFWLVGDDISKFEAETLLLQRLVTKSNEILKGQITRYDGKSLHFQLVHDSIRVIPITEIKEVLLYNQETSVPSNTVDTVAITRQDIFNNSVFFTTVAFPEKKNAVFYRNVYVYYNTFSWYVTSRINVNAFVLPFAAGANVKFILPLGKSANFGLGTYILSANALKIAHIMPFGVLTLGNKKSFLSISYHAVNTKPRNGEAPKLISFFNIGGSVSVRSKLSIFADYIYSDSFEEIGVYNQNSFWTAGLSYYTKVCRMDLGVMQIKHVFAEDGYPGADIIVPSFGVTVRNKVNKKGL
ncbi:MAG: hypothetical protein IT258_14040 [Saprospiraceae bacterium]|nr:hypothetical protein [Saprospiraceae bacterium]